MIHFFVFGIGNSSDQQRRRTLSEKMRFHGCKLPGLSFCYILCGKIATDRLKERCYRSKERRDEEGILVKQNIFSFIEHDGMHASHSKSSRCKRGECHV